MADNQIEFDIVARLDAVDKSLAALQNKADKTGRDLQDSLGNRVEAKLKSSFSSIAASAIAAGASILAGLAFKEVIAAASEEQVAINQLNQSLANAGTYSAAASQQILDFAANIQKTTTVSDDAAISLVALARNFTKTNEQATKLTQAAIELSAATGISLDAAVEGLGKSLTGQAGRLAQQVPLLRSFTAEQLKAGAAIDGVLNRFGGSAAAQVNTFAGAFAQLKNTFNDLQESIGNLFIKSPVVVALFKELSRQIIEFNTNITNLSSGGQDPIGILIKKLLDLTQVLSDSVIGTIATAGRQITALAQTFSATADFINGIIASVTGGGLPLSDLMDNFSESLANVNKELMNPAINDALDKSIAGFKAAVDAAAPLDEVFKNNPVVATMNDAVTSVNLFEESYKAMTTSVAISSQKIAVATKQVKQALFQNVVNGVQSAFSAVGAALVKGENVFAAFGKSILGLFGDIALQLGQFYLLLGIGNLFLNPAAAAGQIAAGIGLSILGGALKALAGGGGGAVAPSTAATGGGVGGGGFSSGVGDNSNAFADTQPQQPGTQVAVNIYGSVLGDKRTLGAAVVDAINESFASDGTVIARGAIA